MIMIDDLFRMKSMEYGITPLPENPVPGMAYVPYQNLDKMYQPEQGLENGTLFPVLHKPFIGCGGKKND